MCNISMRFMAWICYTQVKNWFEWLLTVLIRNSFLWTVRKVQTRIDGWWDHIFIRYTSKWHFTVLTNCILLTENHCLSHTTDVVFLLVLKQTVLECYGMLMLHWFFVQDTVALKVGTLEPWLSNQALSSSWSP